MRFALFGNIYQQPSTLVRRLIDRLQRHGASVTVDRDYYDFLQRHHLMTEEDVVETFEGDSFEADFAVSVGGDGTLLETANRVGRKQTPILGINTGRLGFLADVSPADMEACVEALFQNNYAVESRTLIQVEADGKPLDGGSCALNDVAILKRDTASMISIRATIDGDYLTTYQADGLIVSTPTGSTAYSLSNGGPIIVPRTGVLLMTAVAPHSLNIRPIVIPDTARVELTVSSRSHSFLVAIDGRSMKLPEGTTLILCRAPYKVQLVKPLGTRYFNTLREKMMWGADGRVHSS